MKAIVLEKYGRPEVFKEREVPAPQPKADEVRIKVFASGVNFADILQRLHLYGNAPKLPYVPGFEVAGEVRETGRNVRDLAIGDRVVALTRFGGYAEEVCAAAAGTRPIPGSLTFEQAAAVPVNFLTAWFCLFSMGNLQAGERVLIQGGAGGVGSAAVQLARHKRAVIIATAGSDEKLGFVKSLGADFAVNYRNRDFVAQVETLMGRHGVDVVLDAVGGVTLKNSYELLAPLGRLVSYGLSAAVSGPGQNWLRTIMAVRRTPRFRPLDLIGRNVGVFGFHLALLHGKEEQIAQAMSQILGLIETGAVAPVVAQTFPLTRSGVISAHHFIHDRKATGKVVLVRQEA